MKEKYKENKELEVKKGGDDTGDDRSSIVTILKKINKNNKLYGDDTWGFSGKIVGIVTFFFFTSRLFVKSQKIVILLL